MTNYWYPKASKVQDFSKKYVGSTMNTDTITLHSTEGTGWPGYSGGATAPNMTIMPDFKNKKVICRQHFPSNKSARALENRAGGVNTNTQNTFQIELVGTCDPTSHRKWAGIQHIYMPEAPQWFIDGVADVVKWIDSVHPQFVPVDGAPRGWGAYPSSYGNSKYRLSFSEWNKAKGIVGHQHIPENGHGDPGNFPIDKLIAASAPEDVSKKLKVQTYYVDRDITNGYDKPNGSSKKQRKRDFKLYTIAYKIVDGEKWVQHPAGLWYRERNLRK